jgi:hypothetical protein
MVVFEKISPSGSCGPGPGLMVFLFSIPLVAFLVIRNLVFAFTKDKKYWIITGLHGLIIAIFLIIVGSGGI